MSEIERVRLYPASAPNGSGLVWAHGGGFAAGDLDMPEADHVARTLAATGTTVLSVDCRLSTRDGRHPFSRSARRRRHGMGLGARAPR